MDGSVRRGADPPAGARDVSTVRASVARTAEGSRLDGRRLRGERAKRCFDLCAAIVLLVLVAPLLAALAIAIKLQSPGPVLFRQTRLGRDGRPFEILKLRSMTVCESAGGTVQATRADPRVTPIGRFMRRASLDELPQLVNVVRGEMSLVGPRPHAVDHEHYYEDRIVDYALRRSVRPGVTGLAQVSGRRGATPRLADMQARVEMDLWYVRNRSFALDLRILVLTVPRVLWDENAY